MYIYTYPLDCRLLFIKQTIAKLSSESHSNLRCVRNAPSMAHQNATGTAWRRSQRTKRHKPWSFWQILVNLGGWYHVQVERCFCFYVFFSWWRCFFHDWNLSGDSLHPSILMNHQISGWRYGEFIDVVVGARLNARCFDAKDLDWEHHAIDSRFDATRPLDHHLGNLGTCKKAERNGWKLQLWLT